jgi:hypothetical protein
MTGMDHGVAVRIEQTQPLNYRRLAVNGAATVIETFEILLDSRTLVAELEKIELVEAPEGVEQRLWKWGVPSAQSMLSGNRQ